MRRTYFNHYPHAFQQRQDGWYVTYHGHPYFKLPAHWHPLAYLRRRAQRRRTR